MVKVYEIHTPEEKEGSNIEDVIPQSTILAPERRRQRRGLGGRKSTYAYGPC